MDLHRLADEYCSKSDEELIELSSDADQLTPDANLLLQSELARRRIDPEPLAPVRKLQAQQAKTVLDFASSHRASEFISETLATYHRHFWLFLKLVAPAVVVGYIAVLLARTENREIGRHLGRTLLHHPAYMAEMFTLTLSGFFVSWLAFCASFGAICTVVQRIAAGHPPPPVSHCFSKPLERLGSFLKLSVLLFVLVCLVFAIALPGSAAVFLWLRVDLQPHFLAFQILSFTVLGTGLLVLSRFALAIPALLLGNCTVWQAMFRSDELTEGKWLTLGALLAKSIIGAYVAGMMPFWLAAWILGDTPLPAWSGWAVAVASISAVMPLEPPMFIGFALLYVKSASASATAANNSAAIATS